MVDCRARCADDRSPSIDLIVPASPTLPLASLVPDPGTGRRSPIGRASRERATIREMPVNAFAAPFRRTLRQWQLRSFCTQVTLVTQRFGSRAGPWPCDDADRVPQLFGGGRLRLRHHSPNFFADRSAQGGGAHVVCAPAPSPS